ncbi:protein spinster homolog 3-like [Genypterus blacodes]|uniref:protein spinster homolog 3-like n=1 Tax=Genypterus blacodes TaxID=154954 RepID=UPI003F760699
MERYILAGILLNIQKYFDINDSTAGFLHTVYTCSFTLVPPVAGYLGDRYHRKSIIIVSLCLWFTFATGSSFVSKSQFWFLLLMRALVGGGSAFFTTVAPTIVADLFFGAQRSMMISAFFIFMPVGSGLAYITGSSMASITGDWLWALRITPILGVLGLVLLIFLCPNPPRGASETHPVGVTGPSSYLEDVKYLIKNQGFVWPSLGITAVTFLDGAFAFWMPTFLYRARVTQGIQQPCITQPCVNKDSSIFGAVTVSSGILGVCIAASLSRKFRDKVSNVDSLICIGAMVGAAPCLLIILFVAQRSIPVTYLFIFLDTSMTAMAWPAVADITINAVIPTRRASALAFQTSVVHILGDIWSPYLIGAITDALSKRNPKSFEWSFHSMKYSLLLCPFVVVLGAVFFTMAAIHFSKAMTGIKRLVEGELTFYSPYPSPATVPNLELSTGQNGERKSTKFQKQF